MPRDSAIIFRDLVGKLDLFNIECEKCGRSLRVSDEIITQLGSASVCGKVRGLADDATLVSFALADKIADHNEPGRNTDSHLQGHTGRRREPRYCLDEGETGADGSLGIMLMCRG
jgi:hypothetical protein